MAYALEADKAQLYQIAMLNELDNIINKSGSETVSWGHVAQIPQPAEWRESFLSLSIEWKLCSYISSKLSDDSSLIKHPGRPLLHYAICPLPIKEAKFTYQSTYPVFPTLVSTLLAHGADPNEKFQGQTAWVEALSFVWSRWRDMSPEELLS